MDTTTLADGTVVRFAPMRPSDASRLTRFHHTLSADTTYLRFFSLHPELSAGELHRFTHVDHANREAIVAVVDGEIIGVARFDRLPGGTDAEVAFVVADPFQGRGVGSALFTNLAFRARELGVERFVAETLPHNARMLAVFRHSGLPMTERFDDGVVHLVMDITKGPWSLAKPAERPVRTDPSSGDSASSRTEEGELP